MTAHNNTNPAPIASASKKFTSSRLGIATQSIPSRFYEINQNRGEPNMSQLIYSNNMGYDVVWHDHGANANVDGWISQLYG